MARIPKTPRRPPGEIPKLEVAIVGGGIRPEDVSIRHLSEVLAATATTIDTLAEEAGTPVKHVSLKTIRKGSAVLVMWSDEDPWEGIVRRFHDATATRGASASIRVKAALGKLFRSARIGSIQVATADMHASAPRMDPVIMAAPLEEEDVGSIYTTTIYGRIVGVNSYDDHNTVRVALADGGREDFRADDQEAERAAKLYNRTVRVHAAARWTGEKSTDYTVEKIEPWQEVDFMAAVLEVRDELANEGHQIDAEAWLKELE